MTDDQVQIAFEAVAGKLVKYRRHHRTREPAYEDGSRPALDILEVHFDVPAISKIGFVRVVLNGCQLPDAIVEAGHAARDWAEMKIAKAAA